MDQTSLLRYIVEFNDKSRPKLIKGKNRKEIFMKAYMLFMNVEN